MKGKLLVLFLLLFTSRQIQIIRKVRGRLWSDYVSNARLKSRLFPGRLKSPVNQNVAGRSSDSIATFRKFDDNASDLWEDAGLNLLPGREAFF